jgi:hypothetical protein
MPDKKRPEHHSIEPHKPTSNDLEMKLTPLIEDMIMPTFNASFIEPTHDPPPSQTHEQPKNHTPTHFEHPNLTQPPKRNMQTHPKASYYSPFATQRSP